MALPPGPCQPAHVFQGTETHRDFHGGVPEKSARGRGSEHLSVARSRSLAPISNADHGPSMQAVVMSISRRHNRLPGRTASFDNRESLQPSGSLRPFWPFPTHKSTPPPSSLSLARQQYPIDDDFHTGGTPPCARVSHMPPVFSPAYQARRGCPNLAYYPAPHTTKISRCLRDFAHGG